MSDGHLKVELIQRLHFIESQLHDITTMIEHRAGCPATIRQILAVRGELNEIRALVLTCHLTDCLSKCLDEATGDAATQEQSLAEVVALYQLLSPGRT